MKIIRAKQTCMACPSQFEVDCDDGSHLYMRYRGGHMSIRRWASGEDTELWENGVIMFSQDHGHHLDGFMTFDEFCEIAKLEVAENAELDVMEDTDDLNDDDFDPPWFR